MKVAEAGIAEMEKAVDTLNIIPNNSLPPFPYEVDGEEGL
jgi:cell division GTPase FtsZ